MKKLTRLTQWVVMCVLLFFLSACGSEHPSFSKVVVKSNDRGVLLETSDRGTLNEIHKLFYDRKEDKQADAEFFYLIDITVGDKTTRWQYSDEGFIRNYEEGISAMIYEINSVNGFNALLNIK